MAAAGHDGQLPHVAIFPFMARGHTVPMTHLACLLRRRCLAAVTFFTTPGNAPFVRGQLDDDVAVVELPFPDHVVARGAAEGVEALDSLFPLPAFVEAVSALRPGLEASLAAARPRVGLLVADAEVIARVARELMMMVGEGKGGGGEAARNVAALAAKAREAVAEGGSSWKALEEMVATLCRPVEADTPFLPK
uniref:Uncharacterized protein n=1 Tax=Oryza barthii TaxID=65489 RepID=A0A0D3FU14_9ORYZ